MIKNKLPIILLIMVMLLQAGLTSSFILTHYYELKNSATDSKAFEQLLFNILNGKGITTTIPPPYITQSWLGIHFSPIIYLIVPLYYFFPHIETLLLLQSTLIALAALPIFFIAKKLLNSEWQAVSIAFIYLINPFVVNAQIWDFHEIAFAPLTFSVLLWAIITRNKLLTVLCCFFLITIKEHYGLAVFGTGLLWAWHYREIKFGLSLAAMGFLAFVIVIKLLMPYFNPLGAAIMLSENSEIDRFSWLMKPFDKSEFLIKKAVNGLFYFLLIIFPFLFLPLLSFVWLFPAIADMVVNSLANEDMMRHPASYHSAAIIPIMIVTFSYSLKEKYNNYNKINRNDVLISTISVSLVFSYLFTSLPFLSNNLHEFTEPRINFSDNDKISRNEMISIIGTDSSISAQINILSYVPVRHAMYVFPNNIETADYIVLHTETPFKKRLHVFGLPFNENNFDNYFTNSKDILMNKNFGVIYYKNNWLILKKSAKTNQNLVETALLDMEATKKRLQPLKKF